MLTGALLGFCLCLAAYARRSWFRVDEGHLAVVSRWGAALRRPDGGLRTWPPGLHAKRPWDVVRRVPVMEQVLDLSGEEGGRTVMAADGTRLRIDSILRYRPEPGGLERFVFGLRSPVEHVTGLFTCLLRGEMATFDGTTATGDDGGSYAHIRRERRRLDERLESFCRERIGPRYGVRFDGVDLVDVLPPDGLADALNAVIGARAESDAAYARAEAEANQRVVAAGQGVAIARERAKAVEVEILMLGEAVARLDEEGTLDDYVARRGVEVASESRTLFLKRSA